MRTSPFILTVLLLANHSLRAQFVNDGATNTLSDVTNVVAGGVTVGTNGTSTLLVLASNCLLTNTGLSQIGLNVSARSNEVRLVSSTARWLMLNPLSVGVNGSFNRLTVSNGAQVACSQGAIGDSSPSASNNTAVVNGAGSVWSMSTSLYVGQIGGGNRLEVSDGGSVQDEHGTIGVLTGGNLALVTGANSIWSNRTDLTVGVLRGGNQLVVSNGGTAFSAGSILVGDNPSSTNNRVIVEGGTLRTTNTAGTGVLEVRRGTNVLNAGLMEVDQLLMTNTAGWFEFNGGTLSARNTRVGNGRTFRVGDGVRPATFTLVGGGGCFFNDGLSVSANGTLTGDGNIGGNSLVTVLSGGTLAPGTGIGKIVLSNTPIAARQPRHGSQQERRGADERSGRNGRRSRVARDHLRRFAHGHEHWNDRAGGGRPVPAFHRRILWRIVCVHHAAATRSRVGLDQQAVGGRFH